MNKKNEEITLQEIVNIFLPKVWIIALVAVFLAGALGVYSLFLTKDSYTSEGKYMVNKIATSEGGSTTLSSNDIYGMQSMIANAKQIISTHDFCDAVISGLGKEGELTINNVKRMVSVELSDSEATCYTLKVTGSDKQLAYDMAKVAGNLLVEEFEDTDYPMDIKIIDNPRLATAANSKNLIRNVVIGFLAGALVTMIVIFICDRFDIVIRNREKIEKNFDLPILGVIPRIEEGK